MRVHKATLIQDISEYLLRVREHLAPLLTKDHLFQGVTEEAVITWIIEEELDTNYCLFVARHEPLRNDGLYVRLYRHIDRALPMPLWQYTQHYIKAPLLYGDDTEVKIRIQGCDLFMEYYHEPTPFPPIIS